MGRLMSRLFSKMTWDNRVYSLIAKMCFPIISRQYCFRIRSHKIWTAPYSSNAFFAWRCIYSWNSPLMCLLSVAFRSQTLVLKKDDMNFYDAFIMDRAKRQTKSCQSSYGENKQRFVQAILSHFWWRGIKGRGTMKSWFQMSGCNNGWCQTCSLLRFHNAMVFRFLFYFYHSFALMPRYNPVCPILW